MSDTLEFELVDDGHKYRGLLAGQEVGHVEVDLVAADGMLIKHTEVSPKFEGRGFGGQLVRHVLEDAKRKGRGVIPICPYAAAFIKKRPEYMEYVRESYRAAMK
jgi:predicted GNAT family acetyltransferase